jgi:hypothetical protein
MPDDSKPKPLDELVRDLGVVGVLFPELLPAGEALCRTCADDLSRRVKGCSVAPVEEERPCRACGAPTVERIT